MGGVGRHRKGGGGKWNSFFFFRSWYSPGCSRVCVERCGDQFTLVHVRCLSSEAFTPGTFVLAQMGRRDRRHTRTCTPTQMSGIELDWTNT